MRKQITRKNKYVNGGNGCTVTRVIKRTTKHVAAKEKEKSSLSMVKNEKMMVHEITQKYLVQRNEVFLCENDSCKSKNNSWYTFCIRQKIFL